ncbi:hypothetical protein B7R21_11625 [Subtercola boreus]|uniref:Uncharacterized protein n=1 Tax=Subtercola boreus TaxID=120213 RepID=A0A3E0VQ13_9MICO|nr:hypothetical protein [Subtercola boreus]RFA11976.1 hypothetical protein B7R21_11625 [Subtercola boreus]
MSTADTEAIVRAVQAARPLPETAEELDAGALRQLTWQATRAGVTPAEYLAQVHVDRAATAAQETFVADVLSSVRAARAGGLR